MSPRVIRSLLFHSVVCTAVPLAVSLAFLALPDRACAEGISGVDVDFFDSMEVDTNMNCIPERVENLRLVELLRDSGESQDTLRLWISTCESRHAVPGGWLVYLSTVDERLFPARVGKLRIAGRSFSPETKPLGCPKTVAFTIPRRVAPYSRTGPPPEVVLTLRGGWEGLTTLEP